MGGLFNAENLVITNGRVFVTGSKGVYEVVTDDSSHRLSEIPIRVGSPSDQWVRSGIASDGSRLYLACSHVHDARPPFPGGLFGNIRDIEQTLPGLGKLMLAEMLCRCNSFIVAADFIRPAVPISPLLRSSRPALGRSSLMAWTWPKTGRSMLQTVIPALATAFTGSAQGTRPRSFAIDASVAVRTG